MRELSPQIYFGERELSYVPKHFIGCNTPVTEESVLWINTNLIGRFALANSEPSINFLSEQKVYFEDPAEATIYELRWSN